MLYYNSYCRQKQNKKTSLQRGRGDVRQTLCFFIGLPKHNYIFMRTLKICLNIMRRDGLIHALKNVDVAPGIKPVTFRL